MSNIGRRQLLRGGAITLGAASAPMAAAAQFPSSDAPDPEDAKDPAAPPNLKRNSQVDARFPVSYRRSVPAACRVMAAHFDAIATRDYAALGKTLHYPCAVVERIDPELINSPADLTDAKAPVSLNFMPHGRFLGDNPRTGYSYLLPGAYDILTSLEVLMFDAVHVNMAMTFDRYNAHGERTLRCEGVYCVTNNDGRWAIQLLSTIWTPAAMIGRQYPDTVDAALRLRANHILSYLDDNDVIDRPRPHRGPSAGITGGGVGALLENMRQGDRMAPFKVRGVKTRLNMGQRSRNPLAMEIDPLKRRAPEEGPHVPKWTSNRPEWHDLGYDYGMTSLARDSRVIHHNATKAHRVAGVTRYTPTGEELSTSMEVSVIVLGSGGEWTPIGNLRYLTAHDRTNDM